MNFTSGRSTVAALLLGALAIAAPVGVLPSAAQDARELVVYNAQHESVGREWVDAFTKATGIKVTMRQGSDMQFANQIIQEGAASPADIFLTENSPAMVLLAKAGLLSAVDKDTLGQVPAEFRPSEGTWLGIAARSTVFAYDKTRLTADKLPKSILDLSQPAWKGRWGAAPAGADFQAIVAAMLETKGEAETAKWLKAMKANSVAFKGNSVAMKGVNAGEVEGAVIYHYYWFGDQAKTGENSAKVGLHYFKNQDPGAFVSISAGGVLKSSKHQKDAQAFLAFITGKDGQGMLRDGTSNEYSVGSGVASNPKLVPLAELQAPKIDPGKLDSKKVIELMTAAGLI